MGRVHLVQVRLAPGKQRLECLAQARAEFGEFVFDMRWHDGVDGPGQEAVGVPRLQLAHVQRA